MKRIFLFLFVSALSVGNANALIVDLNSRVNDLSHPVDVLLGAGVYTINPIGTADGGAYDAWNAWGSTTCGNPDGCPRTSPTTVVGWLNIYSFGSPDLMDVSVNGAAAVPTVGDTYYVGDANVYPDPLSALAHAWSAEFTLMTSSMVSFAIPDIPIYDNVGGMSLEIRASSVPEPAGIALMGLGLVGLGLARRKLG